MNRILGSRSNEEDVESVKNQAFCGSAKLWIRQFRPEDPITNPRQYDPKNVSRLARIFELEGCLRLHPDHHVPVIVSRQRLNNALRLDESSIEALRSAKEPSLLSLHESVSYLHGAHRLEAGNRFLHPDDRWWVADLYLEEREKSSSLLCFPRCLIVPSPRRAYQAYNTGSILKHIQLLRRGHISPCTSMQLDWRCCS